MSRGRSSSPRLRKDEDMDIDNHSPGRKPDAKVIIVTNLTRNVVESHLKIIFGFYGQITKFDLPLFGKSGQNRGKAALEYAEPSSARKAVSHMDGGQLDGAILKVELSDLPIRSNSRSPIRGGRPRRFRNGRDRFRSFSRSPSRSPRSRSPRSRSRSPLPPPSYRRRGGGGDMYPRERDSFRGRGGFGRRGPPGRDRDYYRPARSRSRSRSPIRRGVDRAPPIRRRSPSYTRGGYGRRRSRSYSVRSSRSRSRSFSRSKSRSRSMSYSSASRNSRSRTRTRSVSRAKRSRSRDDIRDSRSRSP